MMNPKFLSVAWKTLALSGIIFLNSCINKDENLGRDYLADNQKYDIYSAEFDIEDIELSYPDSLSAYSLYKLSFGAIKDETFGLSTRACAFTLVPVNKSLDFGKEGTRVFKKFHFSAVYDSVSCSNPAQASILQNVNVYELEKPINFNAAYPDIQKGSVRITDGIPVYNGKDSLSFNFSKAFGEKYMTIQPSDLDAIKAYTKKFPGIYISTDKPLENGGRINMFRLPIDVSNSYIYGSVATLYFKAEYEGKGVVDTSFIFYLGPLSRYDMSGTKSTTVANHPQIAYNMATTESAPIEGKATDKIYFEGGRGVKPVIKAASIRQKALEIISKHGNPETIVINKASLILPFDFPANYTEMDYFPKAMSPTTRIVKEKDGKKKITFAGISDSSVKDENQGNINRSLCNYAPDMTHHFQEIIKQKDASKIENYDIWLLAMAEETVSNRSAASQSGLSDFERSMMYQNYYNNMYNGYGYGGGYGGYGYGYGGGYGGYGGYNYFNYMYLSQMYASRQKASPTKKQTMMDPHRFYRAVLNGPQAGAGAKKPKMKIVYSVPKAE